MKLSGSDRKFLVGGATERSASDSVHFEIKVLDGGHPSLTFIARVSQTQACRPDVKEQLVRYCQLHPEKLPQKDYETIPVDLNYVEIR